MSNSTYLDIGGGHYFTLRVYGCYLLEWDVSLCLNQGVLTLCLSICPPTHSQGLPWRNKTVPSSFNIPDAGHSGHSSIATNRHPWAKQAIILAQVKMNVGKRNQQKFNPHWNVMVLSSGLLVFLLYFFPVPPKICFEFAVGFINVNALFPQPCFQPLAINNLSASWLGLQRFCNWKPIPHSLWGKVYWERTDSASRTMAQEPRFYSFAI